MSDVASLFNLTGRTALVTGASGGIGREAAMTLAAAGAQLVLVARSADRLAEVREQISTAGGQAFSFVCDISEQSGVDRLARELEQAGLHPDILVNNAGTIDRSPFDKVEPSEWQRVISLNLTAPLLLAQAVVPHMRKQKWGRIVNVASILAIHGKPNAHSYSATKHGIAGLTRSMASELGSEGICVNAICPGYIRTEINVVLQNDTDFDAKIKSIVPLKRWGSVEDLSGPLLMLCSDAASFVNGHLMVVDGGLSVTH